MRMECYNEDLRVSSPSRSGPLETRSKHHMISESLDVSGVGTASG